MTIAPTRNARPTTHRRSGSGWDGRPAGVAVLAVVLVVAVVVMGRLDAIRAIVAVALVAAAIAWARDVLDTSDATVGKHRVAQLVLVTGIGCCVAVGVVVLTGHGA